ncbi:MAG TPA: DUF2007 domain-containing protein, partial [Gemmataceae bacterium]|nr:DUF2007 domain-containing protein [Gemmataceae bacterium]
MHPANPNLVEIYRAKNLAQAYMIRIALEEAGIHADIDGALLQGAVGDLPIGWPTAPRILVEQADAALARSLIDRVDDAAPAEPDEDNLDVTHCLSCGAVMPDGNPR